MAHGAISYCLKPVDEKEVGEALEIARKKFEELSAKRVDLLLSLEDLVDHESAVAVVNKAGLPWDANKGMRVLCGHARGRLPLDLKGRLFLINEDEPIAAPVYERSAC
ncbi:MAG: hypothetical protein KatS3mg053_1448 [Candidatus Roseilinea sp.]|nr:MAG: hypothetical protein KatS3mg053_1448 [Candidatus Roseilinea sp.]